MIKSLLNVRAVHLFKHHLGFDIDVEIGTRIKKTFPSIEKAADFIRAQSHDLYIEKRRLDKIAERSDFDKGKYFLNDELTEFNNDV